MADDTERNAETISVVAQTFPDQDPEVVFAILERYGARGFHRERERVRQAILKLSQGDMHRLIAWTKAAESDYRDVLSAAERPPAPLLSKEELRERGRQLMIRLGIDPDNPPKAQQPSDRVCPICGVDSVILNFVRRIGEPDDPRLRDYPLAPGLGQLRVRRSSDPYVPSGTTRPTEAIELWLTCRNDHLWDLIAHFDSTVNVEWDIAVRDATGTRTPT